MSSYDISGNCEIELPDYMVMIQPNNDEAGFFGPIIACGFYPGTKNVVMLTAEGEFHELDAQNFFSTENVGEEVYPIENGQSLRFVRQGVNITVDSDSILNAAEKIQLTNLDIGMSHENQNIDLAQDDKGRNGEKP